MSRAATRLRWTKTADRVLLVASLAALAVWLHDRSGQTTKSLVPLDAQNLVISRAGQVDIVLERGSTDADADWRIVQPCALEVEPRRLAPLFEALAGGGTRYPLGEVDAVGAGLDTPLATLSFDGQVLAIGGTDLSGERRYAASDQHVELVPEWIWPLVNGGLSAIAVPDVFTRTVSAITSMEGGGQADADHGEREQVAADITTRWNALQAVQIIAWPPDGENVPVPSTARRATLAFEDGDFATRDIVLSERYDALVHADGGCAHLLAPATLPFPADAARPSAPRDAD